MCEGVAVVVGGGERSPPPSSSDNTFLGNEKKFHVQGILVGRKRRNKDRSEGIPRQKIPWKEGRKHNDRGNEKARGNWIVD